MVLRSAHSLFTLKGHSKNHSLASPMTMNPLPPQAYTKETLLKAYQWLQKQNDSIREMASTPDILVSLYLKAKFNGDSALDRPSIQNFKSELKSLAGMMGEFETPSSPPPAPPTSTESAATNSMLGSLDARSRDMIREVKNDLNLSSEQEALRLLISVGYKRLGTLV